MSDEPRGSSGRREGPRRAWAVRVLLTALVGALAAALAACGQNGQEAKVVSISGLQSFGEQETTVIEEDGGIPADAGTFLLSSMAVDLGDEVGVVQAHPASFDELISLSVLIQNGELEEGDTVFVEKCSRLDGEERESCESMDHSWVLTGAPDEGGGGPATSQRRADEPIRDGGR